MARRDGGAVGGQRMGRRIKSRLVVCSAHPYTELMAFDSTWCTPHLLL